MDQHPVAADLPECPEQMLCRNCQRAPATVHLTGWRISDTGLNNEQAKVPVEFHLCEACARQSRELNHLVSPVSKTGSSPRHLRMRVVKVSAETIEVRLLKENRIGDEDRLLFLSSRFPSDYAVEGLEFEMAVTEDDLKTLTGEDAENR